MASQTLKPGLSSLYDEDFAAWAFETARLIRERRFEEIDAENLAEEVEDMGKSQRSQLENRLAVLISHLLKWKFQVGKRSRSWQSTIVTQRIKLRRLLKQSPSLRPRLSDTIREIYDDAVRVASVETGLAAGSFPSDCPFSPQQILEEDFLP